ncbi:MAG: glycerol kinase GlpK [Candidatus Hydrogenedentes bacterium]|nr:glycerol kinase GlpK [Candidatus Hydrogenedentota bacterium]
MAAAQYLLAIDQGTTSTRAMIFDNTGRIVATSSEALQQHFPQPGWVEHDAAEIWGSVISVCRQAIKTAGGVENIAAIGITNQRETTVLWDKNTGAPLHRAIVWQDRRTAEFCEKLRSDGLNDVVREKTGLVLDPYFSGTKLKYLLDKIDPDRTAARAGDICFGTIDSWLIWKLTSGTRHVSDASNASRTLLFNIHEGEWDDELLALLKVPRSLLPEVVDSSGVCGETESALLGGPIPIAGIAGDQQAALFGQQCTAPGMVKNTYGTGCFMLMHTGTEAVPSKNNLLTTVAWRIDGKLDYALEGSVFIAGAVVQWLRDEMGLIKDAAEVETLARTVPDNGGIYLVPAFAGLGAPHWDQYARGTVVGITRGTNKGHFARAALEGIAYQVVDVLKAMEADAGPAITELRVDGGATANDLLMQFQSDMLDVPIARPTVLETTALGAAFLAGLGVGFWPDRDALASQWNMERRFSPAMTTETRDQHYAGWKKALERARDWDR